MKLNSLILAIIIFTTLSCGKSANKNKEKNLAGNVELRKLCDSLKTNMIDYIEVGTASYTKSDVDECITLLDNYKYEISQSLSKKEGIEVVRKVVFDLNKLNKRCAYGLIETDEREQICEIIILASHKKGYNTREEDITEKLREW